ncbi:MAG: hypothetical protein IBJ09_01880 [Bacteroidia bacterium]|nr:hypothetical protein [Bacteroidia bacterium]
MLRTVVRVKRLLMLLVLLYFAGILFSGDRHFIPVFSFGAGYLFFLLAYTALFLYMRVQKRSGSLYIIPAGKSYMDHYAFMVLLIVSVFFAVLNYVSEEPVNKIHLLNIAGFGLMYILFKAFPEYNNGLLFDAQSLYCPKAFFGVYSWEQLKMLRADVKRSIFSIHVKSSASREIDIDTQYMQVLKEGLLRYCPPEKRILIE